MARLTKPQAKAHAQAEELLTKDVLDFDDKLFVIEHWQESAQHVNTTAGAFFTPYPLASDLAIEVGNVHSVIDLCAGIGTLSLAVAQHHVWDRRKPRMVCVELNPAYVAVGRKILPEAEWITGSVFDLPHNLSSFDVAISNPPFGSIAGRGDFELQTVEQASRLARRGVFILPQQSVPFTYSGAPYFTRDDPAPGKYERFNRRTGIELEPGCGIDTTCHESGWHLVAPKVEVALADFDELDHQSAAERVAEAAEPDALFDLGEVAS